MSIKKLFAMFMLLSFLAATNVLAEEDGQKYRDVFYPDGMPGMSVVEHGQTVTYPYEYNLCDEKNIPGRKLRVVVYTLINTEDRGYKFHRLYISIIQPNGISWEAKFNREISDYITLSGDEEPGYLEGLDCTLDYFKIASDDAVHLDIYANIGQIYESSDIFYIVQNNELVPVLELLSDGEGDRHSGSYTYCYLADVDSDGVTDILLQPYNTANDTYENHLSDDLGLFKYNREKNKYELKDLIKLPEHAIKLN